MATPPRKTAPGRGTRVKTEKAPRKYSGASPRKAGTSKTTSAVKGVSAPETPVLTVIDPVGDGAVAHVLRKKELIDRVVEKSGLKRKDAKPGIEAMLEVLGEALDNGEELNLQPFGKLMVKRTKDFDNAKVMIVKIRQRKNQAAPAAQATPTLPTE
jgi:DNA-binding protein HU-alpha